MSKKDEIVENVKHKLEERFGDYYSAEQIAKITELMSRCLTEVADETEEE